MAGPTPDLHASPRGPTLSRRTADLHASPIRDILAVIDRPGMISFAGGLPAAETFPDLSLQGMPRTLLQYGPSEGEPGLRARVAQHLAGIGLEVPAERVLILSGSQQGIDLAAKLCIDPGTPVAVESPTYLAALQVFRFFGARFSTFAPHSSSSDRASSNWASSDWASSPPSLVYTTPTFQNPTGRVYSAAARAALAAACDAHGVILFEDDPYRDLVYDPCDRTPVCARLERASWIYQGSFSKSLAPGLRLGFLASSPDLQVPLVCLKQAADLHSSRVSQWLVIQQLDDARRAERLAALAATYKRKRDEFAAALARQLGDLAHWSVPPGGLFFWVTLAHPVDTRTLLPAAIERGVAFMPGEPFYPQTGARPGTLRLNFSHEGADEAERGLGILAGILREVSAVG